MTSGMMRRVGSAGVAFVLVGAVGLSAIPAASAANPPITWSAFAGWQTGGSVPSNVSLQVTQTQGANSDLFFFVSQEFCDAQHDQEVFRSFSGAQPAQKALFAIGTDMSTAVMGARHVPMSGSEQRIDGCTGAAARRVGSQVHTHSLASFRANILGSWTATARVHEVQPGIRARTAQAYGVELSGGPLNLGDLGATDNGEIRRTQLS